MQWNDQKPTDFIKPVTYFDGCETSAHLDGVSSFDSCKMSLGESQNILLCD